jgi:acyl-CoA thioester hydrolase
MSKLDSGSTAKADGPEHVTRLRVRYGETDAMGWVYYANYLLYFEAGRSDLIRRVWKSYRQMEDEGLKLPVTEAHCKYLRGARYDDEIDVHTRLSLPSAFRIRFDYEVKAVDSGETLAVGNTLHCFVDNAGKPIRIPRDLFNTLAQI